MPFISVEEAIERVRRGEMLIVVDDEDRENEGDLTMAAARATPEAINFMIKHGRGLVCVPTEPKRLDELTVESGMLTSELVPALRAGGPGIEHGGLTLAGAADPPGR